MGHAGVWIFRLHRWHLSCHMMAWWLRVRGTDKCPTKRTAAMDFLSLHADLHPRLWGGSSFPPGRSVSYFNLECSKQAKGATAKRYSVQQAHPREHFPNKPRLF